jgi:hypothetical protein
MNLDNGKSIECPVLDRGPFARRLRMRKARMQIRAFDSHA